MQLQNKKIALIINNIQKYKKLAFKKINDKAPPINSLIL